MTTSGRPGAGRRMLERRQVGGAALAGLLHGAVLAVLVAAFGWWTAGGWSEPELTTGGWLLAALALVLLTGAWFGATALLRRRGLRRARSAVSWSLALSTVLVAVLTVAAGWVAVMVGVFSALVIWSGEYTDDIAIAAVVLVAGAAVLLATASCVLFTAAFANVDDAVP